MLRVFWCIASFTFPLQFFNYFTSSINASGWPHMGFALDAELWRMSVSGLARALIHPDMHASVIRRHPQTGTATSRRRQVVWLICAPLRDTAHKFVEVTRLSLRLGLSTSKHVLKTNYIGTRNTVLSNWNVAVPGGLLQQICRRSLHSRW